MINHRKKLKKKCQKNKISLTSKDADDSDSLRSSKTPQMWEKISSKIARKFSAATHSRRRRRRDEEDEAKSKNPV
jgi:hypothetical protein